PARRVQLALSRSDRQVVVSVQDRGEGIAPGDRDRVFERFRRLESGLARRTGGTGLGLYIARQLVEAMGGRLWLDSAARGSTFSFTLPLAGAQKEAQSRG